MQFWTLFKGQLSPPSASSSSLNGALLPLTITHAPTPLPQRDTCILQGPKSGQAECVAIFRCKLLTIVACVGLCVPKTEFNKSVGELLGLSVEIFITNSNNVWALEGGNGTRHTSQDLAYNILSRSITRSTAVADEPARRAASRQTAKF